MAAVPIALAAAWTAVSAAAVTFATALTFGSGLMAGLSAWGTVASVAALGSALMMKPPALESAGQQVNLSLAGAGSPLPVVVGRTGVQGMITYRDTYDSPSGPVMDVLLVETILSVGPINGIANFTLGGRGLTFSGSPMSGLATVTQVEGVDMVKSKLYRENGLKIHHRLGAHNDNATLATITGESPPGITSIHRNSGLARTIIRCALDGKSLNFPQGFPDDPVTTLEGILAYDPRLDSTYPGGSGPHRWTDKSTRTWSENPVIVGLNIALGQTSPNGELLLGFGYDLDDIDLPSFVAAANVCDANGWKVGGQYTTADGDWTVLTNVLAAGGAIPFIQYGRLTCFVRAPQVSTFTLTQADILGSPAITTTPSMQDRPNRVIPTYREPNQKWELIPGEAVENSDWLTLDGGDPRTTEITYPFVQQAAQAHQLAAYQVADQREMLEVTLDAKPRALACEVGKIITVSIPHLGLSARDFLVLDSRWDAGAKVVKLSLRADSGAAKHAFCLGQSQTAPAPATLRSWDVANPNPPSGGSWVISATSITGNNSTTPALIVTGEVNDPNVAQVIIETRNPVTQFDVFPSGTGSLTTAEIAAAIADYGWAAAAQGSKTATEFKVTTVEPNRQYQVGVSYLTQYGVVSDRLILGPVSTSAQLVAGVSPGVINWQANASTNPITNVPPVLTTIDGAGRFPSNSVTLGNTTLTAAFANTSAATGALNAAVTDLDNRLDTAEATLLSDGSRLTSIEGRTTAVETGKATITDLNAVKLRMDTAEGTISAHTGQISTLSTTVAGKASASDLSNLTTRVTSAEGVNTAQNSRLNTVESDVAGKASATSVASLEAKTNALANSAPNLIINGDFANGYTRWIRDGAGVDGDWGYYYHSVLGSIAWFKNSIGYICSDTYPCTVGDTVSFSFEGDGGGGNGNASIQWVPSYQQVGHVGFPSGGWGVRTKSESLSAPAGTTGFRIVFGRGSAAQVHVARVKVNYGSVATPWSDQASSYDNNARIKVVEAVTTNGTFATASRVSTIEAKSASYPNLLKNSDFSAGLRGWPNGQYMLWGSIYNQGIGSYVARYATESSHVYLISEDIPCYNGMPLSLSFNGDGGSGVNTNDGTAVYITVFNSAGTILQDGLCYTPVNSRDWSIRQGASGTITASGASYMRVAIRKGSVTDGLGVSRIMLNHGLTPVQWNDAATVRDTTARISTTESVVTDAQTKLAEARFVIAAEATGGRPARMSLVSDSRGTSAIALDAAKIYFGDNTIFDDPSDTVQSTWGSRKRVIAWGAPFGSDSLTEWEGDASVALADMTKANASFWRNGSYPYSGSTAITDAVPAAVGFTLSATSPVNSAFNVSTATISVSVSSSPAPVGSVTYKWTQIGGTTCTISSPNSSSTVVNVGHTAGDYATFQVTVADNERVKTATVRVIFRSTA